MAAGGGGGSEKAPARQKWDAKRAAERVAAAEKVASRVFGPGGEPSAVGGGAPCGGIGAGPIAEEAAPTRALGEEAEAAAWAAA